MDEAPSPPPPPPPAPPPSSPPPPPPPVDRHHSNMVQVAAPLDNATVLRLGKSISLTIEMFATVGETIADENVDIRGEMLDACRESRSVGASLEKLCESLSHEPAMEVAFSDIKTVVRTLKCLLAAVTRILLLADNIVVKQFLVSKETQASSNNQMFEPNSLNTMHHFTEFVKAFCDFGMDMAHLVHIIMGDCDNQEREERRKAQLDCARGVLEQSASLLLTSSKTFLCHPDISSARENRDAVFCQMRRGLDLVHYTIKEGVVDCAVKSGLETLDPTANEEHERAFDSTVLKSIKYFEDSVEIMRMSLVSESYKEQITSYLNTIIERTQDFTDSAYTSHERRQNILLHCDRAKVELSHLLRSMADSENTGLLDISTLPLPPQEVDDSMRGLIKTTKELAIELQQTALENSNLLERNCHLGTELLMTILDSALMGDADRLQYQTHKFREHIDYVEDVSKLIRHITHTESAQICARHAQINLHIYGPQLVLAANTLCEDNHSKISKANLENFCNMWRHLISDIVYIAEQAKEPFVIKRTMNPPVILKQPPTPNQPQAPEYPSNIPRSPCHLDVGGNEMLSGKFHKSVPNLAHSNSAGFLAPPEGHEPRRHSTSGVMSQGQYPHKGSRPEDVLNSFKDVENNEIIKRARKMATQASDMQEFIKGHSKVKNTQDMFTLAEYFAEEANLLYKVIRLFSYDVPTGEDKRSLMAIADNVPKHCHHLQMLIQSPIVGKAATFTKVDSIIKETRQIMQLIVRVVNICHTNANKYNLDFSNVTLEGRGNSNEDSSQPFGSSSGSGGGSSSGNDSS